MCLLRANTFSLGDGHRHHWRFFDSCTFDKVRFDVQKNLQFSRSAHTVSLRFAASSVVSNMTIAGD